MSGYREELELFEDRLDDRNGPDDHTVAATDRIYASAVYDLDYGIEREREHRPGDVSAVPIEDNEPYGLRIEIEVREDIATADMERLLEEAWDEDRYSAMEEIDSVKEEYGQLLKEALPRASTVLGPVLDAALTVVDWEEDMMTHGQIAAYTVADHGPDGNDLPEADKTTIGLMDWDGSRYVRILPEDRKEPDRGLEAAERITSWLDDG